MFDHYVRLLDDQQKYAARHLALLMQSAREVRSAALSNISLSRLTLTEVMKRTRDADESIRQETYRILAQKIPFQKLSVEQRVDVVRSGLSDSSDRVRAACVEMIKSAWLPVCKGDIPTLLGFLDIEEYEECAEILLRTLLQDASDIQPFGNKKTVTVQEALFWRMFAEQIKTRPAEVTLIPFACSQHSSRAVSYRLGGAPARDGVDEGTVECQSAKRIRVPTAPPDVRAIRSGCRRAWLPRVMHLPWYAAMYVACVTSHRVVGLLGATE